MAKKGGRLYTGPDSSKKGRRRRNSVNGSDIEKKTRDGKPITPTGPRNISKGNGHQRRAEAPVRAKPPKKKTYRI